MPYKLHLEPLTQKAEEQAAEWDTFYFIPF